jgi:phage terminase small subunit
MTRRQPDLSVIQGNPKVLRPPPDLTDDEKQIFVAIVAATDAKHFVASDLPLLASYCVAICQERTAHQHLRVEGYVLAGRPSPWITVQEKSYRQMASLSMRLRLSPQGRRQRAPVGTDRSLSAYERIELEERNDED